MMLFIRSGTWRRRGQRLWYLRVARLLTIVDSKCTHIYPCHLHIILLFIFSAIFVKMFIVWWLSVLYSLVGRYCLQRWRHVFRWCFESLSLQSVSRSSVFPVELSIKDCYTSYNPSPVAYNLSRYAIRDFGLLNQSVSHIRVTQVVIWQSNFCWPELWSSL